MPFKILLVEDDMALAMGIEYSLQNEGYEVTTAKSCKEVYDSKDELDKNTLILLDVMLPDGNGFEVLQQLRAEGIDCPAIFLTAVSDEVNVVQGLEIGADDYISKPFRVKELISRIRAVGRRYRSADSDDSKEENKENRTVNILRYRDIIIDTEKAVVYKLEQEEKRKLELTPSEYRMLIFFISNQGIVLERNVILERIFDSKGNFVDDNTLSVYVRRLREKIGDADKEMPYISTVRGVGYMMTKETEEGRE